MTDSEFDKCQEVAQQIVDIVSRKVMGLKISGGRMEREDYKYNEGVFEADSAVGESVDEIAVVIKHFREAAEKAPREERPNDGDPQFLEWIKTLCDSEAKFWKDMELLYRLDTPFVRLSREQFGKIIRLAPDSEHPPRVLDEAELEKAAAEPYGEITEHTSPVSADVIRWQRWAFKLGAEWAARQNLRLAIDSVWPNDGETWTIWMASSGQNESKFAVFARNILAELKKRLGA